MREVGIWTVWGKQVVQGWENGENIFVREFSEKTFAENESDAKVCAAAFLAETV